MKFRMRPPVTALGLMLAGAALTAPLAASTPLPEYPFNLKDLTQKEPARTAAALAYLNATLDWSKEQLTADDTFRVMHSLTNTQGECVVRFQQYFKQHPVSMTGVIVKVAPDGTCTLMPNRVLARTRGLPAASKSLIAPEDALKVVAAKLAPTVGFAGTPSIHQVLFPAQAAGELVMAKDPATGLLHPNPLAGGESYLPPAAYVPAYEVHAELLSGDPKKASLQVTVMVDAETGAILNRSVAGTEVVNPFLYAKGPQTAYGQAVVSPSALLKAAADRTALAAQATTVPTTIDAPAGSPSQLLVPKPGVGNTPYSGQVAIPTTYDPALQGYGLLDTTRGGAKNGFTQEYLGYTDSYGTYHLNTLRPAGNTVLAGGGIGKWIPYTMDGISGSLFPIPGVQADAAGTGIGLVTGRPNTSKTSTPQNPDFSTLAKDNVWGNYGMVDSNAWPQYTDYGNFSADGEGIAAEAMNFMTNTYEFMNYAFNRKGLDNQDSSMTIYVNYPMWGGTIQTRDKIVDTNDADGNPIYTNLFTLFCGVGDFPNNIANPAEPTHLGIYTGLLLYNYLQGYSNPAFANVESTPVAIGFAALMSQGIPSIGAMHGLNRRVIIPTWTLGSYYFNGAYDADMAKPSLDGISPDAYYDGLNLLYGNQGTYSAGPVNRAYYFMAQGASATEGAKDYSTFLPAGMQGIGLEKTCKIAYKAVTEQLPTVSVSMAQMRTALLKAATDLYGDGSAEVQATANAWAAVNVGPAWGQADPIQIRLDAHNWPDDSPTGLGGPTPNQRSQRYYWVPIGETVQLHANVTGTTDTSVLWNNNPTPFNASGLYDLSTTNNGTLTPEGLFTPPLKHPSGFSNVSSIQVASKADPKQFAQGMAFGVDFDVDGDGYNDALDLGWVAMAYGLPLGVTDNVNTNIMPGYPGIGENELQMWLATFQNAFCQ